MNEFQQRKESDTTWHLLTDFFHFHFDKVRGVLLTIPVVSLALWYFFSLDKSVAKAWDIEWGFWWIFGTGALFIAGLSLNAQALVSRFKANRPSLKSLYIFIGLCLFFGIFTLTQIDRQHRVLSDETSWESMGMEMFFNHSGGVCNQGWFDDHEVLHCTDVVNNFKGKTTSLAYWVLFHFFPPNRDTALGLNFWLYLASLLFFFYGFYRVFREENIALAIVAFLAGMPIFMMQAMSASTEVHHVFLLSCIFLVAVLIPPQSMNWKGMLLLIPLIGLYSQTRQETVFSILPIVFYYHSFLSKKYWHLPLFTAGVIVSVWPILNTIMAYRGFNFQGGESYSPHSLENFWSNTTRNIEIMLNLEPGFKEGLLKVPFYTSFTALLLAGTAFLFVYIVVTRRYAWGAFLVAFFHLQSVVILVNISGSFDVEINQRYVLIALPSFALIMGLFIKRLFSLPIVPTAMQKRAALLTLILASAMSMGLAIRHKESFNENIMYRRNGLLKEENFLHFYLNENFPENAVFIYSRPWQMLCTGFSSFSETTALQWSPEEFAKWNQYSNGNIYVVRGQDGYGKINPKARVIGFKTTNKIESLYQKYDTVGVYQNARNFGYPLTITKLTGLRNVSPFKSGIFAQLVSPELAKGDSLGVMIKKSFAQAVQATIQFSWKKEAVQVLNDSQFTYAIPDTIVGLQSMKIAMQLPDSTSHSIEKHFFIKTNQTAIVSRLPFRLVHQAWGTPGVDRTVEKNKLTIAGRQFDFGLGTHAASKLTLNVTGYTHLLAYIGLDDESACGDGAVFVVLGDGKTLYKSDTMYSRSLDSIQVDIRGIKELTLETQEGENNQCDHTNWAGAWLWNKGDALE